MPYRTLLKPNQHCSLKILDAPRGVYIWMTPEGVIHRVGEDGVQDGPAVISDLGTQEWCINGDMHRLDGPAAIYANGHQYWWLDDLCLSQEEWSQDMRVIIYHSQTQEGAEEWMKRL